MKGLRIRNSEFRSQNTEFRKVELGVGKMDKNESEYFNVSTGIPPDKLDMVKVKDEFIEVACELYFRGKTNSYIREQSIFEMIVDRDSRVIKGIWNNEWTEVSPGIETRKDGTGTRYGNIEQYKTEIIRIHRSACPVHVHFQKYDEYNDYDGEFSESHSRDYWVRYESE